MTNYHVISAGCHRWRLLINCSSTTIVLRLNEIRYCSIVAESSLGILTYHSLPKDQTRKIQKSSKKKCDTWLVCGKNTLYFSQFEFTEFYSERRKKNLRNWRTRIQCSDFLHQFLYDRDKKTYRSQDIIWGLNVSNLKNDWPCGLWDMSSKRKTFSVFFSSSIAQSTCLSRVLTNTFNAATLWTSNKYYRTFRTISNLESFDTSFKIWNFEFSWRNVPRYGTKIKYTYKIISSLRWKRITIFFDTRKQWSHFFPNKKKSTLNFV